MKLVFIVFFLFVTSLIGLGQNYTNQIPPGIDIIPQNNNLDISTEFEQPKINKTTQSPQALHFGETINISENFESTGKWEYLGNERYLWKLIVTNEKANAVNAYLSEVNLSKEEELYIYCPDLNQRAIVVNNENQSARFGTSIFKSNTIIIEFISKEIKDLPFTLKEIGFSTSENKDTRDFGDADFCEISVNCPEGDDYKQTKNSVSRILVKQGNSLFWCTGSLINNTKKDGTPYLLTANHCGDGASEGDYSDWIFDFNFESPDCDKPVFEPEKKTVYGSKLLANAPGSVNSFSDFKLLLLDQQVPSEFSPYYIGWDRSGSAPQNGAGIHHPQGDIKMVSTYLQALTSTHYHNDFEDLNGKYWRVKWSETVSGYGVTEPGSSGSPIYNEQGLLVGTLTGGDASCNNQDSPDWYGKFSYHWESNGNDSTTQLKYWLDPINSGVELLNGSDLDSSNLSADFAPSTRKITIGGAIEFTNLSQGNITNYKWFFEGGQPETSDKKEPETVRYFHSGSYDVKLTVKSTKGSDSLIASNLIKVGSLVYPSPTKGLVDIKVGDIPSEKVRVQVFNSMGQKVMDIPKPTIQSNGILGLDLSAFRAGGYAILVNLDGFEQAYKVVLVE